MIALLNYIVRPNDTHVDATKASTDLVFIILNTDSKMKQEGIKVIKFIIPCRALMDNIP